MPEKKQGLSPSPSPVQTPAPATVDQLKAPENYHFQGIVVGIPTFGKVSGMFMLSQLTMSLPIFCNMGYHTVQGKPVDIARNEIAFHAMHNGQAYVLFRDDDTIAPRDTILKLQKRFPMDQRTDPGNKGNMVVGGIVYSKTEPPTPMVFRDKSTAGFEDWEPNDLVQCDVIGMGCTMVPIGVFRKTLQHVKHYRCVNDRCEINWSVEHKEKGNCPSCGNMLFPDWFKTVRDTDDTGKAAHQTEDTYFFNLCKKAGVKIYADAGVLCEHESFHPLASQCKYYYYHLGIGPSWRQGAIVYYYPSSEKPIHEKMALKPRGLKNGPVKFNLGSGPPHIHKKGYVNIDLHTECDFRCDAKNLAPAIREYGQADRIRAYHILEHMGRHEVILTLRNWLKALKPGGVLDIEVPDGEWACENFLDYTRNGGPINDFPEMVIYGRQNGPGDEHRTCFYKKKIESLLHACHNQIAKSTIRTMKPKAYNQKVIRVKVTKKG